MKKGRLLITVSFAIILLSFGCSNNNAQKKVGESLAPGTVDAIVTLTKYDKTIKNFAEIKILKINGYGANTSPLAINTVIKADVFLNNVKNALENVPVGSDLNILLQINKGGMNLTPPNKYEINRVIN